jgi:hypothetical protein
MREKDRLQTNKTATRLKEILTETEQVTRPDPLSLYVDD